MPQAAAENGQPEEDSLHGETAVRRQAVTELLFFSSVGDVSRCKKIVDTWRIAPADEKCCDYDKRTALHLAAAKGSHSVAMWLLDECKVGVNPIDRFSRTPLEEAVRGDHGEVVALLQKYGAKVVNKGGELVDLAESALSYNVRIFDSFDPEWEIDPTTITFVKKIGEGEFGVVHKAKWHGTTVAVKVLKQTNQVAMGDFRTELNVLQKVHHPHTVQFLGAVTKQQPYMIVTEYMSGGSLADFFKSTGAPHSIRRAVSLALDTAKGMNYLHNRSPEAVIHRDLKPANLMVGGFSVNDEPDRKRLMLQVGVVKIADFGLSKSLKLTKPKLHSLMATAASAVQKQPSDIYKLTGETGSYRYMAPEVFRHEPYNTKVDVYAFAMICFQLFEGLPPFWNLDPIEAARQAAMQGLRPQWGPGRNYFGAEVPQALKELVQECWAGDYDQRPAFDVVVDRLQAVFESLPLDDTGLGGAKQCCAVQ